LKNNGSSYTWRVLLCGVPIGWRICWMSELAAKLARRRALNGESSQSDSVPPAPQFTSTPSQPPSQSANRVVSGTSWRPTTKQPELTKKPEPVEQQEVEYTAQRSSEPSSLKLDSNPILDQNITIDSEAIRETEPTDHFSRQPLNLVSRDLVGDGSSLFAELPLAVAPDANPPREEPEGPSNRESPDSVPLPDPPTSPSPSPLASHPIHSLARHPPSPAEAGNPPSPQPEESKKLEEAKKPQATPAKRYPVVPISSKLFDPLDAEPFFELPAAKAPIPTRTTPAHLTERAPSPALVRDNSNQSTTQSTGSVEPVAADLVSPTPDSSAAVDDLPIAAAIPSPPTDADPSLSTLDLPDEAPTLQPNRSDLDEFEDFLETIDKDLVGDFRAPSLSVSAAGDPVPSPTLRAAQTSSDAIVQENKDLKSQVHSLRKIFHDKTQRFNQLQRELTSLRLSLQPQSKSQARSASLFHVKRGEEEDNTDEFLSKFDEFQKTSSRQGRRLQSGNMFDDQTESQPQRSFRKSEKNNSLEGDLFYLPSEQGEEQEYNSSELNSQLKEQVPSLPLARPHPPQIVSLTQSVSEKDLQITKLESDIRVENERVRSRSLSSAESDGSGPSGIAALRNNIGHMGFDSDKVSLLSLPARDSFNG
jgi:hypothetical protein